MLGTRAKCETASAAPAPVKARIHVPEVPGPKRSCSTLKSPLTSLGPTVDHVERSQCAYMLSQDVFPSLAVPIMERAQTGAGRLEMTCNASSWSDSV
eukprot:6172557-Pleurochrysis_carterae.AAC.6